MPCARTRAAIGRWEEQTLYLIGPRCPPPHVGAAAREAGARGRAFRLAVTPGDKRLPADLKPGDRVLAEQPRAAGDRAERPFAPRPQAQRERENNSGRTQVGNRTGQSLRASRKWDSTSE
ncbi:hypothetical protein scyTo_0020682 [Scyliorhinus torazame]|uniref:Uncharacterized protein n=1 Tax=Scyliorhinus torazame TaxID=75743 RepID=A0A401PZF7_SCYTO|nr:hypothetical protein [Scyliorhinus torazame]